MKYKQLPQIPINFSAFREFFSHSYFYSRHCDGWVLRVSLERNRFPVLHQLSRLFQGVHLKEKFIAKRVQYEKHKILNRHSRLQRITRTNVVVARAH